MTLCVFVQHKPFTFQFMLTKFHLFSVWAWTCVCVCLYAYICVYMRERQKKSNKNTQRKKLPALPPNFSNFYFVRILLDSGDNITQENKFIPPFNKYSLNMYNVLSTWKVLKYICEKNSQKQISVLIKHILMGEAINNKH